MRSIFVIACLYLSLVGCCREITQPSIVAEAPKIPAKADIPSIVILVKFSEQIASEEGVRRALDGLPVESVEISVRRMNLYRVVLQSDRKILPEILKKKFVIDAEESAKNYSH